MRQPTESLLLRLIWAQPRRIQRAVCVVTQQLPTESILKLDSLMNTARLEGASALLPECQISRIIFSIDEANTHCIIDDFPRRKRLSRPLFSQHNHHCDEIVRMAEVLGVLASASQLVQYAVKISAALSAVHNRVRGAPKLAKYIAQLEELKDASILIQQSPNIQTTQILRYIESAVNDCENLLHLIDRLLRDYTQGSLSRRYYKAARGGKVEAQIEDGFKRLEQTKTSLIFCIGVANTERLSIIQHGVGEIAFGMASATVQQTVRDVRPSTRMRKGAAD